jgi:hypothetical protein
MLYLSLMSYGCSPSMLDALLLEKPDQYLDEMVMCHGPRIYGNLPMISPEVKSFDLFVAHMGEARAGPHTH